MAGCASVFEEPYEEIEEVPRAELLPEIEIKDEVVREVVAPTKSYEDLWARIRDGFSVPTLRDESAVERVARRFAADGLIERIAERSAGYLYYVVDAVDERELPMELVLVPFVESGFSLQAASHAEAHGAWQFIASTARNYEIAIDRFRDDRRNLVTSTRAALDYLNTLYGMFGDWHLAMAAYNCGENRVAAEVQRARRRGVSQPGFSDIAAQLPQETRDYVPRILAVKRVIENPEQYRVNLPAIDNAPQFSVVEIHRDMDVTLVAKLAGMPTSALLKLNPSLVAPLILGRTNTQLLMPHQAAKRLTDSMASYQGAWVTWRMVRLKRPATPSEIARLNRISLEHVLMANPLPPGHFYDVGSTLILPGKGRESLDDDQSAGAVLVTRAANECMTLASCVGEGRQVVPPATVNGLPRR